MEDLAEAHGVLASEVAKCAEESRDTLLRNAPPFLQSGQEDGLSFFDLKNLTLLQYLSDLTLVTLRKAEGLQLRESDDADGDDHLSRIVESRTVLEKLRPVEKKLKHEVDKFLRIADSGGRLQPDDPAQFRPDLEALASDDDEDDGEDDGGGEEANALLDARKYVVPKNVPTALPEEADLANERSSGTSRKRMLSRAMVDDLKRQHMDVPEEEFHQSVVMKAKHLADMKERTRYEEDNFLRLPALSKRERHQRKHRSMTTMGSLGDEITQFGVNRFDGGGDLSSSSGSKKSKAFKKSKGSAGKKFHKRH